ncbi:FAD/NAD(P)-binding domain-containing protein [Mycena sanguinolenta]|uniref:FAD/NAD(P)-binding domain-containing protein n=1 Tax=Mycena sanguinolenta TaxID=230812 RepID=A0A8H7D6V8_9AGAR|nr:FAD/NAD(P)-binding domain-containing protein [Mycena sanguinolenta]
MTETKINTHGARLLLWNKLSNSLNISIRGTWTSSSWGNSQLFDGSFEPSHSYPRGLTDVLRFSVTRRTRHYRRFGQGAAMAFEDAATIGCLIPIGTHREDIPARLEAYQSLRKPRGELVNRESLEQITIPSKRGLWFRSWELRTVIHGYDAVEITKKYFKDHFEGVTHLTSNC